MLSPTKSIQLLSFPTKIRILPLSERISRPKCSGWRRSHVRYPLMSTEFRKYSTGAQKKSTLRTHDLDDTTCNASNSEAIGGDPEAVSEADNYWKYYPRTRMGYPTGKRKYYHWDSLPPRNDPSYDILRDMRKLEKHKGKLLHLPSMGLRLKVPPGVPSRLGTLRPLPFLVTEEFIRLAKRFHDEVELDQDDVAHPGYGMILQGPTGSGKTSLCFLLMSMAYANNCVVMYNDCWSLGAEKDEETTLLALAVFRGMNAELLSTISVSSEKRGRESALDCVDAILDGSEDWRLFDAVLAALASYTHRPVVYAFLNMSYISDVHQTDHELWNKWYDCGSSAHGARTYAIYSGVTNYCVKPEIGIAQRNWIVDMRPWGARDMFSYFRHSGKKCRQWLRKLLKTEREATLEPILYHSGGNPAIAMALINDLDLEFPEGCSDVDTLRKWLRERTEVYCQANPYRQNDILDRIGELRETSFPRFLKRVYEARHESFGGYDLSRAETGLYKTPDGYKCAPHIEQDLWEIFVIGRSQLPPYTHKMASL